MVRPVPKSADELDGVAVIDALAGPETPAGRTLLCFELDGQPCRLVCVDGLVPTPMPGGAHGRSRLQYLPGQLGHFEWRSRRYAVIAETPSAPGPAWPADGDPIARLSNRELQIVQLICTGLLTKQVADRMRISEFTVRSYLKTIYCKLGVRSRGAMVFVYAKSFVPRRGGPEDPD